MIIQHKGDLNNNNLNDLLNKYEREIIIKHLKEFDYNITKTASSLGISRQNLQYRIKKHNIKS